MKQHFLIPGLIALFLSSCSVMKDIPLESGVSHTLAQERAVRIRDVRYDLFFAIPDSMHLPIPGQVTLRFELLNARAPLWVDFREQPENLQQVSVNGQAIAPDFRSGHIIIPDKYLRKGGNEIHIAFTAGNLSLNRNEDYLYTLLVPDRASTAFPCFDQPDLKAKYALRLEIPGNWEVSGNGAALNSELHAGRKTVTFKETQPFSTYVFAFAAGRFRKLTQSRDGREMIMYFRETDDAKVARSADTIFDLHAQSIRWLEEYTGIPFPFEKLDFVLLPGFQYGGMEHIGNIFYRESSLMLDESATENQKLGRARLIAHETAHMWFGDMVTMRWFNDVWLKEVFANFMAAKAVNPSFPHINHELSFMLSHQPIAYGEDRSGGSHPIQQELENLREAGSLYGGIIYQKAPVVMRQLEAFMGEDAFRQGLQQYLRQFAYANATWDDLIGILDAHSAADLRAWSQVWVKEPGMPELRTEILLSDGKPDRLVIRQEKSSPSGRYWPQQTLVALIYPDTVITIPAAISSQTTNLPLGEKSLNAPLAVFSNASAMSYGYFRLDEASIEYGLRQVHTLTDPLLRGAVWVALYEELLRGRIAPQQMLESVLNSLPVEREPLNRQQLLGYLNTLFWRFLDPAAREATAARIETLLQESLQRAGDAGARSAYFSAFSELALTPSGVQRLYEVWSGEKPVPGLPLSEAQRISLAAELALRLPEQAADILDRQLSQTQNPDRRKRLTFLRPALSPDPRERDAFFESLKNLENRSTEPWVVDAAAYLNHPLRAGSSEKYIRPSLELLEEIQRTGDIFFPRQFISAVLGGHRSAEAADIVKKFLEANPNFPYRLRNKVLMAADILFRVGGV